MKKIIPIVIALLAIVFYSVAASYTLEGINIADGYVFSSKDIQENLYAEKDEIVYVSEIKSGDGIYSRLGTTYIGEEEKVKVNYDYPMYVSDGNAITLLSGKETLVTPEFDTYQGFAYATLNDGMLFDEDYIRADYEVYLFAHLSNGLYINSFDMKVDTVLNSYTIPANSIIYFTTESIRYYRYDNGNFAYEDITDVEDESLVTIDGIEYTYGELLLGLGETVEYHDIEHDEAGQQKRENAINDAQRRGVEGNVTAASSSGEKTEATGVDNSKIAQKNTEVKKNAKNKAAEKAQELETAPQTPVVDPNEGLVIKYPSWEMPTVTMADDLDNGTGLKPGVYTLKTSINVHDPAGVISGGVVFEIEINEGGDAGTIYKRTSFTVASGEKLKGIVAGLRPDYNYKVRAYFKYMDKYGRVQTEAVYFLEDTEFKTNPVTDLGPINIVISENNTLYNDHISIGSIQFAEDSDQDTVGSLSRINLRTYRNETSFNGINLSNTVLEQLSSGIAVGYEGQKNLESGKDYTVKIFCYDRYGNELSTTGNVLETKTCKKIQEADITVSYVKDTSGKNILGKVQVKVTVKNEDKLKYEDLCIEMLSGTGEYYSVSGTRKISIKEGVTYTFDNLVLGTSYELVVKCKTDIDDGQGYIMREIGSKSFSTSRIEDLGNLYLNVTDYTADLTSETNDAYKRAWLAVSINKSKTNVQLPTFLSDVEVSFTDENQNSHTYVFTDAEVSKLMDYGTVWIDTNKFCPTGLLSNTKYTVTFQALNIDGDNVTNILCSTSLSTVKTDRKPVEITMKNVEALSGYITAKITVSDVDDFVEDDSIILNVYKVTGGNLTMTGSFRIEKNQTDPYELGMFQDSEQSSDGLSYMIEGNTTYRFIFVAEEVNLERGNQSNYVIKTTDVKTIAGVTGDLYLEQLLERDAIIEDIPEGYTQLQYIESTGSEYIELPFGFNNTAEVAAKGAILDTSTDKFLITTASWQTDRRFAMLGGYSNFGVAYGNKSTSEAPFTPTTSKTAYYGRAVTEYYKDKKFYTDDGLSIDVKGFSFAGTTTKIRLFYGYSSATRGRIYFFKYKDGSNDVYLVPVKQDSTGKLGFYDVNNGVFYTQTNTSGSLIAGPKVTEYTFDTTVVPDDYTQIEYVEANGTQYIDTGYVPTENTHVELETKVSDSDVKYAITGNNTDVNSVIIAYNGGFYRSNGIAVDSIETENGIYNVSYDVNYEEGGTGSSSSGYHWEFKYYNDTVRSSYPTLARVKTMTPTFTRYYYDYEISKSLNLGDYYIGYAKTCVYLNEATSISYNISADDESIVYLNGTEVKRISSCATNSVKFNFNKGWNTIEIVYREGGGADGWTVSPQIRTTSAITNRTAGFTGVSFNINKYNNSLKLFGICDSTYNTVGRIYDYKVYEDDTLTMHLVPVKNRNTDEVGFYDVIGEKFYGVDDGGGTDFTGGSGTVSASVTFDPETQYLSKVTASLSDEEEWLASKTTYVDVYRTKDGNTVKEYEGLEIHYDGQGGKYTFYYPVDIDDNSEDSYTFKLYFVSKTGQSVNLASASFTTEEQIYTISTVEEFEAVGTSSRKYVVINDIEYTEDRYLDTTNSAYTEGPWGTSSFNARIDFQGFALTYYGSGPLLYQISKTATITNMVYNEHCVYARKNNAYVNRSILNYQGTTSNRYAGALCMYNYGTLTNIKINYYQDTPGVYQYATYWQDSNEEDAAMYPYFEQAGFIVDNHGVFENFVVNMYGDDYGKCYYSQYGGIVCHNFYDGRIRNGYIYSENLDSNYRAQVYFTGKANNSYGILNSVNESGGVIENCYVLGDAYGDLWSSWDNYNGIICGYNLGTIRNTYTVGNLIRNYKVISTSYGPNIGVNSGNGRYVKNNNYISEYTYNNSSNTSTSSLSLRNVPWQESVLNEGNSQFSCKELVNVNCYPHIKYTSDVMPSQTYISLPDTTIGSVDVFFTNVYNLGDDPELDELFSQYITGDEVWTTSVTASDLWEETPEKMPEDANYYSDVQIVVVYISDKTGSLVYGLTSTDNQLKARCIKQVNDGTGVSCCYMAVFNPTKALNKYKIKEIVYEDVSGNEGTAISVASYGRYLNAPFYRLISGETGEGSWQYLRSNKDENYRLTEDLDFDNMKFKDIHVSGSFTGYLDGQGYSISNINYEENALSSFYSTFSVSNTNSGLFCTLSNATVKNLTLNNIYMEGGTFSGALAGLLDNGYIENVYANNVYCASSMYSGGLFGRINSNCEIYNAGVNNAKVVVTGFCGSDWVCVNAGGFTGWMNTNNILDRVYATNIYVEALDSSIMYTNAGGITPYVEGSLNEIHGAYATGTIISSSMHTGGIVGCVANAVTIDDVYSDVDIYTYQGNTAGGVGWAANKITGKGMLVFGDVIANRLYESDDTATPASINAIGNGASTSYYSGLRYDKMKVNRDNTGTNYATGTTFSVSLIQTDAMYEYLSSDYFKVDDNAVKGVLPKLVDANGNELPGQPDTLIGYTEEDGMIRISLNNINTTYNNGRFGLDMIINHDSNIWIDKVYTDFTYIDLDLMAIDSDYRGINTYSKNVTFTMDSESSNVASRTSTKTTVTMKKMILNAAYDNYHITAIRYMDKTDNSYHYLRLNYNIDTIGQQFKTISSLSEYESKLGGTIAENFYLASDIDFENVNKSYCNETVVNVVVNRLVGLKGSSTDYLNDDAFYKIANISYNSGDLFTEKFGQLYNDYTGLFRNILSELSCITFENVDSTRTRAVGVVGSAHGKVDGVQFIDCDISSTGGDSYTMGLFISLESNVSNIYIENCHLDNASNDNSGILTGCFFGNYYTGNIINVTMNSSSLRSSQSLTSFIVGRFQAWYSYTSSQKNIQNINVSDSQIYGGSYTAGITGYVDDSRVNILDATMTGNKIVGTSNYTGGICGDRNGSNQTTNIYIKDNYIKGAYRTGGCCGWTNYGAYWTVVDTTIISNSSEIGGLCGYYSGDYTYSSKQSNYTLGGTMPDDTAYPGEYYYMGLSYRNHIYGNTTVGGIAGHVGYSRAYGIVEDCEIKGNTSVGGVGGYAYYSPTEFTVKDSTITPYESAAESAQYGITYNASPSYFGGLFGQWARFVNCIVTNCVIGGENANYVGGFQGWGSQHYSIQTGTNSVCQDCIVIGNNYVGGMFGTVGLETQNYASKYTNLYSNAYVYGNNYVGGIAGKLTGYYTSYYDEDLQTTIFYHNNLPVMENLYFTGCITSEEGAGALFGVIDGNYFTNTQNNMFRYVSSLPAYIKAKTVAPLFLDCDLTDYYYNWEDIDDEISPLYVSLWADTKIYITGTNTATTMKDLLNSKVSYSKYVGDYATVSANFTKGIAGDEFIILYDDMDDGLGNVTACSDVIQDNFYTWSLNSNRSDVLNTSYNFYGFTNKVFEGYMPEVLSGSTTLNNDNVLFNNVSAGEYKGVDFVSLDYKPNGVATNNRYTIHIEQGVEVPGTDAYNDKLGYMESLYSIYDQSGLESLNLSGNDELEIPAEYTVLTYLKSTGTQYLILPYTHNTNTWVDMTVSFNSIYNWNTVYGAATSDNSSDSMTFGIGTSSGLNCDFGACIQKSWKGLTTDTPYHVVWNGQNVQVDGTDMKAGGKLTTCKYQTAIFTRNLSGTNYTSEIGKCAFYSLKIYEGTYNNTAESTLKYDLVPVRNNNTNELGMYDRVSGVFYTNRGSGDFIAGEDTTTTIEEKNKFDYSEFLDVYASGVDKLNFEFSNAYINEYGNTSTMRVYVVDGGVQQGSDIINETVTTSTYTINYDFTSTLCVELNTGEEYQIYYYPSSIRNTLMLYGDDAYCLSEGGLYNSSGASLMIDIANIYDGFIMDESGNIYSVDNLASVYRTFNGNSKESTVLPLYEFTYTIDGESKSVYTYATRTVVEGTYDVDLLTSYRLFSKSGKLVTVKQNTSVPVHPVYVKYTNDGSEIILQLNSKAVSIGSSDILSKFSRFTASGIKYISSNLSSNVSSANNNLLVEYENGKIVCYNTSTYMVNWSVGGPKVTTLSLPNFLMTSMSSMFKIAGSSPYTSSASATNNVVDYLNDNDTTLGEIVSVTNDDNADDVASDIMNGTNFVLTCAPRMTSRVSDEETDSETLANNEDPSNKENTPGEDLTGAEVELNINIEGEDTAGTDEEASTVPQVALSNLEKVSIPNLDEIVEEINSNLANRTETAGVVENENSSEKYVSVFNDETEEFEIFETEELIENEEPVSETSRIVDRSSLKALYSSLGENEDHNTDRGIMFYLIIAAVIIALMIPVFALRKKES